ncbi:MAG: CoA-binding protein [Dehalococcoidia bacterium]|nr:CoA-binding protein [Dehalococcoidia bacterium]
MFDTGEEICVNYRMRGLAPVFSPRSVAVVGVSSNPNALANRNFLRSLLEFGYKGRIYPVNPHLSEVMGLKAYASVLDIPELVDYVVCAIPAPLTPKLMEDCVAARAKVVTFYTAGFSETGEEEGLELEKAIVDIARWGGVRVIGPNCLGVHCPKMGVTFEPSGSRESGHVGFVSQSGGNARELIIVGAERGIHFSKGISYGNAADLNEADFVEYLSHDKDTEVVAAYIEGIKQPRRFLRVLTKASESKPVIILKGGKTEAGTRAVSSHTGALAGGRRIWETICRQRGVIQVRSLEEMTDTILAFSYLKRPQGRRVGIVGIGGGASVQAADDCEDAGLIVPAFPRDMTQELRKFIPLAGVGLSNPIDTSADVYWDPALFARTIGLVANSDVVDVIFVALAVIFVAKRGGQGIGEQIAAIIEAGKGTDKPIVVVLRTGSVIEAEELACQGRKQCLEAGLPVYPSVGEAAQAVNHFISYHENRSS